MKGEEKAMVQNALVNSANLAPDVAEAMAFLIGMDDTYNEKYTLNWET